MASCSTSKSHLLKTTLIRRSNPIKVDKIVASLGIKVRPQDLRSKDSRNLLLSIFAQWLPLASSTFRAIVEKIPSPPLAQATRVPKMLHPERGHSHEIVEPTNQLERDLYSGGDGVDRLRVAYVSKMFAVRSNELPENQRKQLTADDMRARAKIAKEERDRRVQAAADGVAYAPETGVVEEKVEVVEIDEFKEVLIGFARLYSGTISLGQTLYAVLPKYNAALAPSDPANARHLAAIKVEQLYMMMGRELVAVKEVQAGNLFAIGGLEGVVGRNATLCALGNGSETRAVGERDQDRACLVNLAGVTATVRPLPWLASLTSRQAAPIVRVALEPKDPCTFLPSEDGLH